MNGVWNEWCMRCSVVLTHSHHSQYRPAPRGPTCRVFPKKIYISPKFLLEPTETRSTRTLSKSTPTKRPREGDETNFSRKSNFGLCQFFEWYLVFYYIHFIRLGQSCFLRGIVTPAVLRKWIFLRRADKLESH